MIYVYDIETYINFTSIIFIRIGDPTLTPIVFILHNDFRNDRDALVEFLKQPDLQLIGHNSIDFDDIVLRAIVKYPNITATHLYRLAKRLIEGTRADRHNIQGYNELAYPKKLLWASRDTLALTRVNQVRVGLKHAGVVLRHPRLQDLPYPPDRFIVPEDVPVLIDYNINDCLITRLMYYELLPIIRMREDISKMFEVDVYSTNDTEIAKEILAKEYMAKTGIAWTTLKEMRTERGVIQGSDCIGKNIRFDTPELQRLLAYVSNQRLYPSNNYKYKLEVEFDDVHYKIGVGGLHSDDKPRILASTADVTIRDADVTSFYPFILINNGFYPAHLGEIYPVIYQSIVDQRVIAKKLAKKGDVAAAIRQAGLKIAINSGFGLMGNRYSWLYDPQALVSITISGQLYLLDLIEKLYLAGIHTLSANTDGIVCEVPVSKEATYQSVCAEWQARTNFNLEFANYAQLIQRDVNNYLSIKDSGEVKTKGIFQNDAGFRWDFGNGMGFYDTNLYNRAINGLIPTEDELASNRIIPGFSRGFSKPVVSIALYQYFVHGIDPAITIHKHRDVHDFIISQRADANKFDILETRLANDDDPENDLVDTHLQKTNRWIVTQLGAGASIYKSSKTSARKISMVAGEHLLLLNDIDTTDASEYNIKYEWYIKETWQIIDKIKPPQAALW